MAVQRALHHCQTFWFIFAAVFFSNFGKDAQRIASSSSGGISAKRLASLRWSFHSLKTFSHVFVLLAVFEFSFLLLRVLISSSCNHGNLSIVLDLLKMEKFGKFSSLKSSMLSTTMATCPSFSADVCSLLIGWFHNLLFFSDFIGWNRLSYFFPNRTVSAFLRKFHIENCPN